jgi:hypothetical protein
MELVAWHDVTLLDVRIHHEFIINSERSEVGAPLARRILDDSLPRYPELPVVGIDDYH